MLVCLAFEMAIKKPGSRILFLAPYQRDAAEIATDLAAKVLSDCPEPLRPTFTFQSKEFRFPNGSILRLKGTNNEKADSLRGGAADLIILDECGQMDNLKYIIESVCLPMVLTTGGRILLASTPPPTPAHDSATIYADLLAEGSTVKYTILDAPHITDEDKAEILRETGEKPEDVPGILAGVRQPRTTTARRELFAEFVTDSSLAVVPEFDADAQADIVRPTEPLDYFHGYVSLDPGSRDKTGILVARYDFMNAKLLIDDEALLSNPTTKQIAQAIKSLEAKHLENAQSVTRVSDIDLRLIADFQAEHKLTLRKAKKTDMLASVQELRHAIQTRRLVISPRCQSLVHQLATAIWNRKGSDVAREGDGPNHGHNDLLAALRYMLRAVDHSRNPYPKHLYTRGSKFGPGVAQWAPPSRDSKKGALHDNTPLARRLHKKKTKPRR